MRTNNVRLVSTWLLTLGTVAAAVACGSDGDKGSDNSDLKAGIKVQALVSDGTDVEGVKFDVTPVSCEDGTPTGATTTEVQPIDPDQTIPGNIAELQNSPLDKDSAHLFADSFQVLPAGCYDVVVTPVDGEGYASEDCARAFKNGVVVLEGETTEIFLINQCKGVDPGALDIIAALNHEPMIEDVNFSDSKFSCGSPTEICAEASDLDGDPLELVLVSEDCDVSPVGESEPGSQCWELSCSELGKHNLTVLAYDLLHGMTADPQRIEDWLAEQGYPNESHSHLNFHAYVDGVKLWPDLDGDGYGDANARPVVLCDGDDHEGLALNDDDCDDSDPTSYPGGTEVCDGADNNCNSEIDEGLDCHPPGADVVVFNDINPFDENGMGNLNNQVMVNNLVNFTSGKVRDAGTVVLMDRGRNSVCGGGGECQPASQTALYSVITGSGLTISDISSTSGSLTSFAPDVKAIFLWNPTVAYTVDEINAFKDFASEGGRVVFIGEWDGYYSTGIPVENDFLMNMGAVMTNIGQAVDCGYNVLPASSLRSHQVTTGMTDVTVACASVIVPGPGDYPLFYDSTNTQVLAGVATIDTTHIATLEHAAVVSVSSAVASSSASGD